MIRIRWGKVSKIIIDNQNIQIFDVEVENKLQKAINYPPMTGKVKTGDWVQLNTTAFTLGLGTGGYHFVLAKKNITDTKYPNNKGHIMKMRYTPQQIKVLAVEEEVSPLHTKIKKFTSLNNTPVVIGFLHSMLIPIVAGIKAVNQSLKISYIMTDGGALPLALSNTVRKLNDLNWLNGTITVGHAFGGDLEAINIYSGLAAAHVGQQADIIIVIMGPGIVGTGTELGTTALEVGQAINAVSSLQGNPIVVPRLSFQDTRKRHKGISHHVFTVLEKIALAQSTIVFPKLYKPDKINMLDEQIKNSKLAKLHNIVFENGNPGLEYLLNHGLELTTMGKTISEEEEFFLTACAAGSYGAKLV